MSNHFGPAGIFSTDDPTADRRQIEAEQWGEEEEFLFGQQPVDPDEYPVEDYYLDPPNKIHAYCGCNSCLFWNLKWIEDTPESKDKQSKLWQKAHAATGCKDELIIGNI